MSKNYTLGRIPYLVCAPFFHQEVDFNHYSYEVGSPAKCNQMLFEGKIHAAPSSSIEYAKHSEKYLISPHFCTASKNAIGSVLLFSHKPFHEIQTVRLTQDSETSVCLLDILFQKWSQTKVQFFQNDELKNSELQNLDAELLIGDKALARAHQEIALGQKDQTWAYQFDLASIWVNWQKLPFVFGLWIFRNEHLEQANLWHQNLATAVDNFYQDPIEVFDAWQKHYPQEINKLEAKEYFNKINYRLQEKELEGLRKFYQLAFECNHLNSIPEIQFLKV